MILNIPQPVDFSTILNTDIVTININFSTWNFSPPDAAVSGSTTDITILQSQPIFGSTVYINDVLIQTNDYGLPLLSFPQGSTPFINLVNNTKYTTNLHFHGLVNTGLVDGASTFGIFGQSTSIGTTLSSQFPVIKNNSALTWYHSHAMYRSIELVLAGIIGMLIITDDITKPLYNFFTYNDNYFPLNILDIDLDSTGKLTFSNLTTDVNRSCFTAVNGISAIQWYDDPTNYVPYTGTSCQYTNLLTHTTTENIVKIDILNPSGNWRIFYLGVCDSNYNIVPFYVIQTDQGLCAPVLTKIQFIPVAGRISILIDLTTITNAYIFMYDYDLSENLGVDPNDSTNTNYIFPDFSQQSATPYPSPIPDPNQENQQENYTNLSYPNVPLISQVSIPLVNGMYPIPTSLIRPFLYINSTGGNLVMSTILNTINNIIYTNGTPSSDPTNYLTSLNKNYYYNIPNVTKCSPSRIITLWGENDINYINGGSGNAYIVDNSGNNIYGVTECCNGANRIYADLWNSCELDLNNALIAYSKSPNNFKPKTLPSSTFRVTQQQDQYINIAMISNDRFTIQAFDSSQSITYNDTTSVPLFSILVILPATPQKVSLNIQQWVDLLNNNLAKTSVTYNGQIINASSLLTFDWSFFPYGVNLLNGTTTYLKSAIIKTSNISNYSIRILGRWPILQMMGKSMTGLKNLTPPTPNSTPCCSIDTPCDENYLYGVYDNYIQAWYPYYATDDENTQNPILCPRRDGQLIIQQNSTYIGLYDGYANDNLRSFCTTLTLTEIWTYLNADVGDSHPLHFHLTSGFSYKALSITNPNTSVTTDTTLNNSLDTLTPSTIGLTQTYSRDIFQIGPQQSISFAVIFTNYTSEDTTNSPYFPNIGAVIHCHFLPHNDSNTMMLTFGVKPYSNIICDICFLDGTIIKTDQGNIPIEAIIPNLHTISKKKIIDIIKTVSKDNYLVCFDQNSLYNDIPSQTTIMTRRHKIFYKGMMIDADNFIGINENIYKVPYNGELLYNILMENHEKILVNNMICETLKPDSEIIKLNNALKNMNYEEIEKIISINNFIQYL